MVYYIIRCKPHAGLYTQLKRQAGEHSPAAFLHVGIRTRCQNQYRAPTSPRFLHVGTHCPCVRSTRSTRKGFRINGQSEQTHAPFAPASSRFQAASSHNYARMHALFAFPNGPFPPLFGNIKTEQNRRLKANHFVSYVTLIIFAIEKIIYLRREKYFSP